MTRIKQAVSMALLAGMALPMSATMASDLYGGGATFPAVPYVSSDFKSQTPESRLSTELGNCGTLNPGFLCSTNIPNTSVFGNFTSSTFSYAQTGSGTGKNVFIGATPANGLARDFSTSALGFSAPQVDYAGTDSPLTAGDITTFNTNLGTTKGAPVQIPSLVGSIALPFRYNGITTSRDLAPADVCRIFRGTWTNWNQVPGFPTTSKPITIVYRSDNSGTSFAFSNWLAANCNATQSGVSPDRSAGVGAYQTNQTFSTAIVNTWYSGFSAVSGNANVVATVNSTDGAIGYADPGDVQSAGGTYMTINTFSPLAFSSPAFPNAQVPTNTVVSSTATASTGLPSTAAAGSTVPAGSMLLINPSFAVPTGSGYPIFAVTYLEFYNRGQNSTGGVNNSGQLRCLVNYLYDRTVSGCLRGRPTLPTGYDYIDDSLFTAKVTAAIARITN